MIGNQASGAGRFDVESPFGFFALVGRHASRRPVGGSDGSDSDVQTAAPQLANLTKNEGVVDRRVLTDEIGDLHGVRVHDAASASSAPQWKPAPNTPKQMALAAGSRPRHHSDAAISMEAEDVFPYVRMLV